MGFRLGATAEMKRNAFFSRERERRVLVVHAAPEAAFSTPVQQIQHLRASATPVSSICDACAAELMPKAAFATRMQQIWGECQPQAGPKATFATPVKWKAASATPVQWS